MKSFLDSCSVLNLSRNKMHTVLAKMTFYQSMNIAKKERILWTWHFLCFNNLGYLSNSSQNCFCSQAFNPCKTLISKNLVSVFFLVFIYTRVNCSSIQTLTNEISKLSGKLLGTSSLLLHPQVRQGQISSWPDKAL